MFLVLFALAVLVAAVGVFARSWLTLVAAGLLAAPLAWYLSMTPGFRGVGLLLAAPPLLAAPFVRTRRWVAGWLVAVFAVLFLSIEMMVLGSHS